MFEDEITIFNKKYNSDIRDYIYIRTYLSGVNVDLKKAANVIKSGLENADSGTIIIPEEVDAENKEFLKPIQFKNVPESYTTKKVNESEVAEINEIEITLLSSVEESKSWTLQPGDIIVLGIIDYNVNDKNTIANLRNTYDDVYEITSVDTNLKGGLPHWEIGVK